MVLAAYIMRATTRVAERGGDRLLLAGWQSLI
jgi:hypothetical protein